MGQAPHIAANDASERSLPGLSPAATASLAVFRAHGPAPVHRQQRGAVLLQGRLDRALHVERRVARRRPQVRQRAERGAQRALGAHGGELLHQPRPSHAAELSLPRAPPLHPRRGERLAHGHPQRREVPGEARPVGRRPLHRDAGRLPGRRDRPGERLVARRVGGELAGQDLAAPPVQDAQPVRVGVGVDPAEDRPAGAGCRFGSHVSLRSFRARLDRADGTLTGRDRMRLFGSAVSLHAPIRSCGGLGSPRPARDMSGNEGSPMGASGMWGHRAVRI